MGQAEDFDRLLAITAMFSHSPAAGDGDGDGTADALERPTRRIYDPNADRMTIVVDVHPTAIDDCRVHAGPETIRVTLEDGRDGERQTRTFTPPSWRDVFTDERTAVYNNGVLEIRVGVARRYGRCAFSSETGTVA